MTAGVGFPDKKVMAELKKWMEDQFQEKRVEPNSGLGEAFRYMLDRWDKFTLFLKLPGAPLHNNIAERALKLAVLHRKRWQTAGSSHSCRTPGVSSRRLASAAKRPRSQTSAGVSKPILS